jgi:hypothetical protein
MPTSTLWRKVAVFTIAFIVPFGILALLLYGGYRLRLGRRSTPRSLVVPRNGSRSPRLAVDGFIPFTAMRVMPR